MIIRYKQCKSFESIINLSAYYSYIYKNNKFKAISSLNIFSYIILNCLSQLKLTLITSAWSAHLLQGIIQSLCKWSRQLANLNPNCAPSNWIEMPFMMTPVNGLVQLPLYVACGKAVVKRTYSKIRTLASVCGMSVCGNVKWCTLD